MRTRIRLETDLDEDSNDTIQRATLMRAHQSSSQKNGEETRSTSELDDKTCHNHKTVEKKTDSGLRMDHIRGQFIIEADIFNLVGVWVRFFEMPIEYYFVIIFITNRAKHWGLSLERIVTQCRKQE
ncbi:hypothetical protein PVK06_048560 [Gossypium arboreum]|uniref:Uncharacterized protein n=1 Tax=Gossypium arboreum TaxID=29729 RepID=A0ABR0MIZ5_GOSAR|nr:hypothetical protein PVK06_048560 [Gossypium arboreum]